jgi:hypothetical protein
MEMLCLKMWHMVSYEMNRKFGLYVSALVSNEKVSFIINEKIILSFSVLHKQQAIESTQK